MSKEFVLILGLNLFCNILLSQPQNQEKENWPYFFDYVKDGEYFVQLNKTTITNAFHLFAINENIYSYIVLKDGKYYANISGVEYGPYDKINGDKFGEMQSIYITSEGHYAFYYTKDKRRWLNINGKSYGPYSSVDLNTIKVNSDGSYAFSYLKSATERYAVINGSQYGPFPNMSDMFCNINSDGSYYYEYNDNEGRYFININGKSYLNEDINIFSYNMINCFTFKEEGKFKLNLFGNITGPYDEILIMGADINNKKAIYKYRIGKDWFLSENGKIAGPYKSIESLGRSYFYLNKLVYRYETGKGQYLNIAGSLYGPYNYFKRFTIYSDGTFAFAFEENRRWYLNINGKLMSTGYGLIDDVYFGENGDWAFSYREKINSPESYIKTPTKVAGPYPGYIDEIFKTNEKKLIFTTNNKGISTVNVYDLNLGPFRDLRSFSAGVTGEYSFIATQYNQTKPIICINGMVFGPFDNIMRCYIGEGGKGLFYVKIGEKYYISENGKPYGPFDKINFFSAFGKWKNSNLLNQ